MPKPLTALEQAVAALTTDRVLPKALRDDAASKLLKVIECDRNASKLRCRFGCEGPVGVYHVPAGCICWPDPVQALCPQHIINAESDGPITLLLDLSCGTFHLQKTGRE